jgi:hypothetical protein
MSLTSYRAAPPRVKLVKLRASIAVPALCFCSRCTAPVMIANNDVVLVSTISASPAPVRFEDLATTYSPTP